MTLEVISKIVKKFGAQGCVFWSFTTPNPMPTSGTSPDPLGVGID